MITTRTVRTSGSNLFENTIMSTRITFKDYLVGIALVLALVAVYGLDQRASSKEGPRAAGESEVVLKETTVEEPAPAAPAKLLRIGVTPPQYDDMGSLLDTLGEGYQYRTVALEDLVRPKSLDDYDILFLTCGAVPRSWLGEKVDRDVGESSRGLETFNVNPKVFSKIHDTLRRFVQRGGTLYASDWRFGLIHEAFPEFIDISRVDTGAVQTVKANVVDSGLQKLIGSEIELRFDMPGWYPAAFREDEVTTYLEGRYRTESGEEADSPLLVKFGVKDGTVIFTSFHNEKQNSELETKLLRYLVFAAVTAQTESKVAKTMIAGGFSPASKNLLSASANSPSVTQTYHCKKPGPTQFVLGFENQGARLRLSVVGPGGEKFEKEGTSTITVDVPNAAAGEWSYTITAIKVPYPNFPFTLVIGQK